MNREFTLMTGPREAKAIALAEKYLDSQLWHACAGGMVQMPLVNSNVFYFPQGHMEHTQASVDFGSSQIPSLIPCKVSNIKYMADLETDEVFAKIRLIPLTDRDVILMEEDFDDCHGGLFVGSNVVESNDQKLASFAKTLTQSDANNGGGFSVPRYCAETIFPKLDYSAEPPVQNILAKDVHGEVWKFRHIYRGTPRRHLLTTGWSNFVNQKKLVAGDSIVFLRVENGDICVGIRRAKRGIAGGAEEYASGWNSYGVCTGFMREEENKLMRRNTNGDIKGKVSVASVVEAANLAAKGQPFEVIYYPRGSSPEFFVKASAVRAAMQIQWCRGMRFKMAFETEDSSRISWFMGSVSSVQVADPIHWPNSPWRLLQVAWDEPDLLQNVKRVSPWLVELVSNMPTIHMLPFSSPRKKLRFPQEPDFSWVGQLPLPSFTGNPLRLNSLSCGVPDNLPAGIQGARHAQFGLPASDLHFNKPQPGLLNVGLQQLNHVAPLPRTHGADFMNKSDSNEDMSSSLTTVIPTPNLKGSNETKAPHILLFGQLILIDQQSSQSSSGDINGNSSSNGNHNGIVHFSDGSSSAIHQNGMAENSSDEGSPSYKDHPKTDRGADTGNFQEFAGSVETNRTLDLSNLGSYKEQYGKLVNIFGIKSSEKLSNVLYRDAAGAIKHSGDGLSVNF